ncbi:MAG: pyridoxamine 5'-phosphate oxidase family protein [Actinomycetota bacterium]
MARWADFEAEGQEMAAFALSRLAARKHKTMATLRADGSPRISGIEVTIRDGDMWIGGMPGARKQADLRRDPRLAIHSGSDDPAEDGSWPGDTKLCGLAVEIVDPAELAAFAGVQDSTPPAGMELFRVDLIEVSTVQLGEPVDHLVIEIWKPGAAVRRVRRE